MIEFRQFLKQNKVMKREKDPLLAKSLQSDAEERMESTHIKLLKAKFKFEQAYESVRELADAFLAKDGYKTYSHEAALAYLKEIGIVNEAELERLDLCRKKRNDLKYYGKDLAEQEVQYLNGFLTEIFKRIKNKIEK